MTTHSTIPANSSNSLSPRPTNRWRTVDIVVAAVLGVALGVVFVGWNHLWAAMTGAFAGFPPGQDFMAGVWLVGGVLGGYVVRRPGAAVFTEVVAALAECLVGNQWGWTSLWYGIAEGLGAEVVFLVVRYRLWRLPVLIAAGAAAGLVSAVLDIAYYYGSWGFGWKVAHLGFVALSAAVIAGVGSWLLVRALAPTGALSSFAAGRNRELV